ncbi:MAG: ATP-binding protein, partial [Verrucomicrobiota bacterium]
QVSRLVENLITNSALAMSQGGVLIVRTARISPEEVKAIKGSHSPMQEDHLLIEVIDTGHGMNAAALNQVFEPYFTTRPENNASGIGLTVCESIAKAHAGFIQLQSKEGKGTIATFCAPLGKRPTGETEGELDNASGAELPMADLDLPALGPLNGTEAENFLVGTRILILEDDDPIRRLMAATLRRAGHEVVETKDGNDTISVYREALEEGARFHLLICDLTIENGLGGVETMRQLTGIDPSILAIVSSGYSDAPAMATPEAFGFRAVLPKPYAPSELRAAVHRILTAHHIIS